MPPPFYWLIDETFAPSLALWCLGFPALSFHEWKFLRAVLARGFASYRQFAWICTIAERLLHRYVYPN